MSNLPYIEIFTALADKYGDSINTLQKAEEFFDDFSNRPMVWSLWIT